ncbi:unnamed protein product [Alopecurus aequalis]
MEPTTGGQSAATVDGVGDGRRFPDPPPPHGRDTDSASVDMAALVFRREQLLQELHRERIRHDMIMCELAETERVMTTYLAGQGSLRGRPLMTPWEEAMYRTSRSSEDTSWWHRSSSGPAIAPVYPRVERSPSPVLQPRSVDSAEKQQRGSSSSPLAVAPSALPNVKQCPLLSKQPAAEEALVPAAANVVAKPALLSKEVTLESRGVVDHEREAGLKDRHAVQQQLMQRGIQISAQLKRAAIDQEHKEEAKGTHAVQLMDCEIRRSVQPMHAAVGQECRVEVKDSHAMQQMECEIKRSKQLKRAASGQEREVDTNVGHAVQVMESKFRRSEQVKQGAVDQAPGAEVENDHDVQPMVSEIQRNEQPMGEASGQEHEAEEKDRHAIQLSKITKQPKPAEPAIKDHTVDERRQLSHQYVLPGKEKSPPNEQKRLVFNEPSTQIAPSGVKGNQILGPIVETPPPKRHKPLEDWSCTYCKVSLSSEEDLTRHQAGDLHQLILALQLRQEAAGLATKSTPESSHPVHRSARQIDTDNLGKNEPQKANWFSGSGMRNHSKHMSHQENTQALHTEEGWNHFSDCPRESTQALPTEEGWNHFSDRSQRESTQALPTEEGWNHFSDSSQWESTQALPTEGGGGGKKGSNRAAEWKKKLAKRRLLCELCNVQCSSDKDLESHLGGKKHRGNLQARHWV